MLGSIRRFSSIAVAAALALASCGAPTLTRQPALVSTAPRPVMARKRGLFGGIHTWAAFYGRKSAGVSAAQQKRISAKRRAVVRNRRHHR